VTGNAAEIPAGYILCTGGGWNGYCN